MENKGFVRLETLRLRNFKNIDSCEICFSEAKKLERGIADNEFSNVVGLYGQNGSGKTSCIEGIRVIQYLLSGGSLNGFGNYIQIDKPSMSVGADFYINVNNQNIFVNYDCSIEKSDTTIQISDEKLSFHLIDEGNKKINFYSFNRSNGLNLLFKDFLGAKNLEVYKMIASIDSKTTNQQTPFYSSIFNEKLMSFINKIGENNLYPSIINSLFDFAKYKLAIYEINYFNEISNVGIRIRIKNDDQLGDAFVSFGQTTMKAPYFGSFVKTVNSINKVLPSIVADCSIEIMDIVKTKEQSIEANSDVVNFRLVSVRNGKRIPLLYESNGIKKIISILSGLIDAFNNKGTFVAIDELDSGIFEYLLGEIIYAFDNFALGQLFFTSHNMRILEKVQPKSLYFSTVNSADKFIQFVRVRESNNLRSLYYRYIKEGYKDKYRLYDNVETEKIISSFSINEGD